MSHLPLLLEPAAGRHGELTGHLARANPQWRTSDLRKPALAIFMGADAYVSPSWYPAQAGARARGSDLELQHRPCARDARILP